MLTTRLSTSSTCFDCDSFESIAVDHQMSAASEAICAYNQSQIDSCKLNYRAHWILVEPLHELIRGERLDVETAKVIECTLQLAGECLLHCLFKLA